MSDIINSSSSSLRQTKSDSNIWNSILALDAKYNHYRCNNPQLRTLYIKRRTQLLRENALKKFNTDVNNIRQTYFSLRSQILKEKFNYGDQLSVYSQSLKGSRPRSIDSSHWRDLTTSRRPQNTLNENRKQSSIYSSRNSINSESISKLKSHNFEEIYAFAGVYHIFDHHKADVTRVKFANNDRSLLATCSLDGKLVICQIIPVPATIIYKLDGHKGGITDMQWSSTNDLIVTSSLDTTSRVWQVSNGTCMRVLQDTCNAQVHCCSFHPSNENMIFTGNSKGFIQVYNLSTGILVNKNCLQKVNGSVQCICFDLTGTNLWVGDNKGFISAFKFDIFTLKLNKTRKIISNSGYSITSLSFRTWLSKDVSGPTILANAAPNYLLLYRVLPDGLSLRLRKRVCIKQSENVQIHSSFCPIYSQYDNICIVCTGSEDSCVYLYDMENDEKPLVNRLQGHSSTVTDVCFNYDESLLASGDRHGITFIWKRENNVKNML